MRTRLIAVLAAVVAAFGACGAASAAHRIRPAVFHSCGQLVRFARSELARTKGRPEPVVTPFTGPAVPVDRVPVPTAGVGTSTASTPAPATTSFSTTNTQEPGVDEPDTVKTDGATIFAVEGDSVRAVDVSSGVPKLVGSLTLTNQSGAQLLLRGKHLIVIASSYAPYPAGPVAISPYYDYSQTTLTEVDVSDPSALRVTRTMTVQGSFVDARQNGGSARFVISSRPYAVAVPSTARTVSGWIPIRRFHSLLTRRRYTVPVAPCRRVMRPVQFSGLGMVTILTVNLDRGLYAADSEALMADPRVVYGSAGSLYLATEKWVDPNTPLDRVPQSDSTVIDRFDLSNPDKAVYAGSGEVPGYVLNQFSLSEDGGYLRVASTSRPIWWSGPQPQQPPPSQSYVTVLALGSGHALAQVGQVAGLGRGQRIYSVRFVGDAGYVVTFRQVDPLYTLDLGDPTDPRVVGALELEGYSSYLQPVGAGLLLGIGQDVGASNEPSGSQIELFEVSDPAHPRLVGKTSLGLGSSTAAAYDHHAFLFWPPTGLALLPVQIYSYSTGPGGSGTVSAQPAPADRSFTGAIGFHIARSGVTEIGRVQHDATSGYTPPIDRAIVIGRRVFTVSSDGVMASSLTTLARESFAPFPSPPVPPCSPQPVAAGTGTGTAAAVICPL